MTALSLKQRGRKEEEEKLPTSFAAWSYQKQRTSARHIPGEGGREGRQAELAIMQIPASASPSAPALLAAHCCAMERTGVRERSSVCSRLVTTG